MKRSRLRSVPLALCLCGLATSAYAVNPAVTALADQVVCDHSGDAKAGVDVHASTLGAGLGIAFPVNNCVAVRVGFNQFNRSFSTSTATANSAVNYSGNLKLSSGDLLLDWYPFSGYTHLTAGVMYNNNKFELNSVGPFTLNGVQYTTGSLNAAITFNKAAPYLGLGWSGEPKKRGWSLNSDFGVMYQGAPTATLSSSNPAVASGLAAEQAALNDKLKHYKYYPVVSIGIGYAF